MKVAIGVITFRRPKPLSVLLASLQERMELGIAELSSVIIVDNDPERSAHEVVANFAASAGFVVEYVNEPRPGVSAARNALVEAAGSAHWLVMVDDDEEIVEGWPSELIRVGEERQATLVCGPVLADTGAMDLPEWMKDEKFFGRGVLAEGAHVEFVPSGNCAISLERVQRVERPLFDERFGLTGGSDSFLTARVLALGGVTAFAPGAITSERYPADRLTLKWLNRRWRRSGATLVAIDDAMGRLDSKGKIRTAGKGIARFGVAAYLAATSLWKQPRQAQLWAASRQTMLAVGTFKALRGWEPNSYGPGGTETAPGSGPDS